MKMLNKSKKGRLVFVISLYGNKFPVRTHEHVQRIRDVVGDALVGAVDHALSIEADEHAEQTETEPQVNVVKGLLIAIISLESTTAHA